jgi:hypothetical protein
MSKLSELLSKEKEEVELFLEYYNTEEELNKLILEDLDTFIKNLSAEKLNHNLILILDKIKKLDENIQKKVSNYILEYQEDMLNYIRMNENFFLDKPDMQPDVFFRMLSKINEDLSIKLLNEMGGLKEFYRLNYNRLPFIHYLIKTLKSDPILKLIEDAGGFLKLDNIDINDFKAILEVVDINKLNQNEKQNLLSFKSRDKRELIANKMSSLSGKDIIDLIGGRGLYFLFYETGNDAKNKFEAAWENIKQAFCNNFVKNSFKESPIKFFYKLLSKEINCDEINNIYREIKGSFYPPISFKNFIHVDEYLELLKWLNKEEYYIQAIENLSFYEKRDLNGIITAVVADKENILSSFGFNLNSKIHDTLLNNLKNYEGEEFNSILENYPIEMLSSITHTIEKPSKIWKITFPSLKETLQEIGATGLSILLENCTDDESKYEIYKAWENIKHTFLKKGDMNILHSGFFIKITPMEYFYQLLKQEIDGEILKNLFKNNANKINTPRKLTEVCDNPQEVIKIMDIIGPQIYIEAINEYQRETIIKAIEILKNVKSIDNITPDNTYDELIENIRNNKDTSLDKIFDNCPNILKRIISTIEIHPKIKNFIKSSDIDTIDDKNKTI